MPLFSLLRENADQRIALANRAPARRFRLIAAMVASLALGGTAQAQTFGSLLGTDIPFDVRRDERVTVTERRHPEYEPLGVRAGGFLIFPEVDLGATFTSNVFGAREDTESDVALLAAPSIEARSQWSRHMVNLRGSGSFRRFLSNSIKDEDGFSATAEARVDLVGQSNIFASTTVQRTYIEQYSGSFPADAAGSVPLDRVTSIVRATYDTNRLRLIGSFDATRLNFRDTVARNGNVLRQDYRDENAFRFSARAEYSLGPATAAFVQPTYIVHDYYKTVPGIENRSGDEIRLIGGLTFDLTSLIRASMGAGYLLRRYDAPGYANLKGLAVDVRLDYLITQLTTISLAARREAQDAIVRQSPGYIASIAQLRVDHELLRNLVPFARLDYEQDDYVGIDRKDRLFRLGAGFTYTPVRSVVIAPAVDYVTRRSKGEFTGQSFDEFRGGVQATLRI